MNEELGAPRPAWLTTPTLVPRPCWISVAELLWAKAAPDRVRVATAARRVRANMGRSPGVRGLFGDQCSAPMSPFYPPRPRPSVIKVTLVGSVSCLALSRAKAFRDKHGRISCWIVSVTAPPNGRPEQRGGAHDGQSEHGPAR